MLDSGVSMIQVIVDKLHLLCQREGLTTVLDHNLALMIERSAIATIALLITGDDMDNVICLQCGMAPKTVLSDGNSKVIKIKDMFIVNTNVTIAKLSPSQPADLQLIWTEIALLSELWGTYGI